MLDNTYIILNKLFKSKQESSNSRRKQPYKKTLVALQAICTSRVTSHTSFNLACMASTRIKIKERDSRRGRQREGKGK